MAAKIPEAGKKGALLASHVPPLERQLDDIASALARHRTVPGPNVVEVPLIDVGRYVADPSGVEDLESIVLSGAITLLRKKDYEVGWRFVGERPHIVIRFNSVGDEEMLAASRRVVEQALKR